MLQCNLKYKVVLFPKRSRLEYIYAAYLISYKHLRTLLHQKESPQFYKCNSGLLN